MKPLFLAAVLLLIGCSSTRKAVNREYDVEIQERVELEDQSEATTITSEQKDVILFVEEIVERIEEPTDSTTPPKVTEKRTTRSAAIDRSTFQEMVSEKKDIDSAATSEVIDKSTEVIESEVKDSTPRNLRWLGILGISMAVIAICWVILRLKK